MYSSSHRGTGGKLPGCDAAMTKRLRGSDYMGIMTDGGLYVLLANTTKESAVPVQARVKENGYQTEIVE